MQVELTAASRHEHLALFDPAAIPAGTPVDPDLAAQDPNLMPKAAITDLAGGGHALVVHLPGPDCEARFRVFVDEEPPEAVWHRAAVVLTGAPLSVPGGSLRADGLEFLSRPGEVRLHSLAETAAIPAGDYLIEVLDLISWKAGHRISEGRRGLTWGDRFVHRVVSSYTWLGIVMIPANVLLAPLLVAGFWRARGWRAGLTAAAVVLAIDVLVFGGFWLLQAAQQRLPSLTRTATADADFDREHPDLVVVLRRRDAGAQPGPAALVKLRIAK